MPLKRLFNLACCILLLTLLPFSLLAEVKVDAKGFQIISLEYSSDPQGTPFPINPAEILKNISFTTIGSLDYPLEKNVSNHWLKITCKNLGSESATYIFDFEKWVRVDLFDLTPGVSHTIYMTGHLIPYDQRNVRNANNSLIQLEFNAGETKSLLVHLQSTINYLQVPSDIRFNVLKQDTFLESVRRTRLLLGVFIGFYVIMLLYNMFIYFSTKDKNYLPYLAGLLASLIITIHNFGFFVPLFNGWEGYVFVHSQMQFYASMLIGWSMLIFTALFLNVKTRYPRFYQIIKLLMLLILFLPVPALLGYASINEKLSGLLGITSMMAILTIAIKSKLDNYPSSGLFLIGYGAFAVGIAVMLSTFLGLLPISVQNFYPVNIGSTIEMVFFSLALGNRINILAKDNQNKQEQIIGQLREKEELQGQLTKTLEQKVVLRTREIQVQKEEIEQQKLTIEAAKEKVDNLLFNILPRPVAQELQENGIATPKYCDNVTVLFADLVNFTKKSAGLRPELVIHELDYCFRAFDEIIDKYQVEKIKTIGDGYMCAAGVPLPIENSAVNAILAALDMQTFLMRWAEEKKLRNETPWEVRIGVHTGEVVAGVVGKRKFAYDIWGGTVNTASRIEAACEPGKVNISGTTCELIKDQFVTLYRGKVQTKEKEIDMYYVLNKK